jgi:hypothetical protein
VDRVERPPTSDPASTIPIGPEIFDLHGTLEDGWIHAGNAGVIRAR